jgi:hypothetical protein
VGFERVRAASIPGVGWIFHVQRKRDPLHHLSGLGPSPNEVRAYLPMRPFLSEWIRPDGVQSSMIERLLGWIIWMSPGNATDAAQNRDRGWRTVVTPDDAENVLLVLVTSWIVSAVALVYLGKFNLILLLIAVGFVTVLVVLSSGLSLLTAIVLQKVALRSGEAVPASRRRCTLS